MTETDKDWLKFTTSFSLTQLISNPTRVTKPSRTLIYHIYTNYDKNISRVHVCHLKISDHYAVFGSRKLNSHVRKNKHNTITYRSFKQFDENSFIADLSKSHGKL